MLSLTLFTGSGSDNADMDYDDEDAALLDNPIEESDGRGTTSALAAASSTRQAVRLLTGPQTFHRG